MNVALIFCRACGEQNQAQAKFCQACGKSLLPSARAGGQATGLLGRSDLLKGRYLIIHTLGQGGFGAVYKAEDLQFQRAPRAIKEMGLSNYVSMQEVQEATQAFKDEAMLLASLMQPNLPRIYDHFAEAGRWYLVMDYIEGETLEARVEKTAEKRLPLERVVSIGIQLCTVLDYLHSRQPPVIFRDLKPANVMITANDHLYLIDFGIARLFKPGQTRDTAILGTPGYAAPEQYGRAQTTPRSDIYSLGATLHYLASGHDAGQNPFLFPPLALIPPTAQVQALDMLLQSMVAIKAEHRPMDIATIRQELQHIAHMPAQPTVIPQTASTPISTPAPAAPTHPTIQIAPAPDLTHEIVVDAQGAGHFLTINEAIQHVKPQQRILVRPGTYQEVLALDKEVEIVGDGPRERIILTCENNHCIQMYTDRATIRGLTIVNETRQINNRLSAINIGQGKLLLEHCHISSKSGSAITIHTREAHPTIRHCEIAHSRQSGIFICDQGRGLIEDCTIYGHQDDGIVIASHAEPHVKRCKLSRNNHSGIFVHEQGRGIVEDCNLTENVFANVSCTGLGKTLFKRCRIHTGRQYGLAVQDYGQGTFSDCEFFANEAAQVYITEESTPTLEKCAIHDGKQVGILVTQSGGGSFAYCAIYNNTNTGITIRQQGNPRFRSCKIYQGQANGVFIQEQGRGIFEDCTIFANTNTGISVMEGSAPTVKRTHIYENKQNGLFIYDQGLGTFSDCEISGNSYSGVAITRRGKPHLLRCKVHHNRASGIFVYGNGAGLIEQCTLTANGNEALSITEDCAIQTQDNMIY